MTRQGLDEMKTSFFFPMLVGAVAIVPWSACAYDRSPSICEKKKMIIDADDRHRLDLLVGDLDSSPWRHIGSVRQKGRRSESTTVCTGTLIGSEFVLTAAHCVDPARGDGISMGFALTQRRNSCTPHGVVFADTVWIPRYYSFDEENLSRDELRLNKSFDYALLQLNHPIPEAEPMDFGHLTSPNMSAEVAWTIGYPGFTPDNSSDGTAWITAGRFFEEDPGGHLSISGLLVTNLDGTGGQSGAPVYTANPTPKLVGVLIGSPEDECQNGNVWAASITPAAENRIRKLMNGGRPGPFWTKAEFLHSEDELPEDECLNEGLAPNEQ